MKKFFEKIYYSDDVRNVLIILGVFIGLICFSYFISYFFLTNNQHDDREYGSSYVVAKQQSEDILECILNEDIEGLKSLFCPKFQKTYNLDSEIKQLFRFIKGEIVSYDEPRGDESTTRVEGGMRIKVRLFGDILNLVTDKGKRYEIIFYSHLIYREDVEYEGVNKIVVTEKVLHGEEYIVKDIYEVGEYVEW